MFLPVFVILIAGLVEISNLVLTQNRISNAARVSSRFAANGGEDAGMWVVALNSVTQTLNLEPTRWDVWSVRGTLRPNVAETDLVWSNWQMNHIYGAFNTADYTRIVSNINVIQENMRLDMLGVLPPAAAAGPEGLQVVGTVILHDVQSILGLDQFVGDFYSVEGYSVMRRPNTVSYVQTDGCVGVFPIAFEDGARSVTTFPTSYEYPSPAPDASDFPAHVPDVSLLDAREGYAYLFEGMGQADRDYGFLSWDGVTPLPNSLAWPGNSHLWSQPGDSFDTEMHINNTVYAQLAIAGADAELQNHIDRERALRVIVFDDSDNGPADQYKIKRFAIFRLAAYDLSAQRILVEFVRWDDSCGQVVVAP